MVLFQSHDEDPEKGKISQNCREKDTEQVTRRLGMAHEEIRRLTDELQGKEKEQSKLGKVWLQMNMPNNVLSVVILLRLEHESTEKKNLLR